MEKYKINITDHVRSGKPILFYGMLVALGIIIVSCLDINSNIEKYKVFFFVMLFIQLIPQFLLHINYYLVNKSDEFCYDATRKVFTYISKGKKIEFEDSDIEIVKAYKSPPLHRKDGFKIFSWDSYNHIIIYLKNGGRISLTNLLIDYEINLPIDKNKIIYKINIYRWAPKSKLI